jgi:hypothetical protein
MFEKDILQAAGSSETLARHLTYTRHHYPSMGPTHPRNNILFVIQIYILKEIDTEK